MLSKIPSDRPQTMKEVAEALLSLPAPAQDAPASFDVAHAETLIREIPKSFIQPNFHSALPISAKESGESSPLQSISADRPPHESSAGSPEPPPFAPPSTPSRRLWRNISGFFFLAFSASVGFFLWQQMSPPSHQHIPPQNRLAPSTNRPPVVSPSSSTLPPHPTLQAPKQAPQKSPVSAPPTQPPQPEPVPNQTDRQTPPLPSSNNESLKTPDKSSSKIHPPSVQSTPTQSTPPISSNKRRWLKIPFELPAQHRLRIVSGNPHVRIQKKAFLLRQGHPVKLEILHISGKRFSYHPCMFQLSDTTQPIQLTPLLSAEEFKPDRIDYCLKSAPEEN